MHLEDAEAAGMTGADLALVQRRIKEVVGVLSDFKRLRQAPPASTMGRSRRGAFRVLAGARQMRESGPFLPWRQLAISAR